MQGTNDKQPDIEITRVLTVKPPKTLHELNMRFGQPRHRILENGSDVSIVQWMDLSTGKPMPSPIVKTILPIVGARWVHKYAIPAFQKALLDLESSGHASAIHPNKSGKPKLMFGTYAARLKRGGDTLSLHAYGIACDINWTENRMHNPSTQDPVLVKCFKNAGFGWLGDYDPMHFELFDRGKK